MNLRNAEATLGKGSSQYLDIMEIIENFMTMQSDIPDTPRPSESETKKADTVFFNNLAFRPKP
jgi:hypothetical protein